MSSLASFAHLAENANEANDDMADTTAGYHVQLAENVNQANEGMVGTGAGLARGLTPFNSRIK